MGPGKTGERNTMGLYDKDPAAAVNYEVQNQSTEDIRRESAKDVEKRRILVELDKAAKKRKTG